MCNYLTCITRLLVTNERDKSVAQVSPESSVNEEIQTAPKTSQIWDNTKSNPETERNDDKCADTKSQDKERDGTCLNKFCTFFISEEINIIYSKFILQD